MKVNSFKTVFSLFCFFLLVSCNNDKIQLPEPQYNPGIAILQGKIINYNSSDNLEVKIGIPNIILSMERISLDIQEDGSFSQEISLQYAMQIGLAIGEQQQYIFMQPEDTVSYIEIDLQAGEKEQQFIYKGTYAELNRDFNHRLKSKKLPYHMDDELMKELYGMSPLEFRDFCMKDIKEVISYNNKRKDACRDAKELANRSYAMDVLESLKYPKYAQQCGAMLIEGISREASFARYDDYSLPEGYYDVLTEFPLNDPFSIYCFNFSHSIPILNDFILKEDATSGIQFIETHAPITEEEQELINDYKQNYYSGFSRFNELMTVAMKYEEVRAKHLQIMFEETTTRLAAIYGDSTLPIFEYMKAAFARTTFRDLKPLTTEQELYYSSLTNPICIGVLEEINAQMKPRKKDNIAKHIICDNPNVPKDEILNEIIRKQKGKVILIDLWATWCAGCRITIKEFEPLKSDFNKDEVAFVYLTNESSPEVLWKKLIPEMEGYHYRLNNEFWDYFWKRFDMIGVPLYIIIDKEGNVKEHFITGTKNDLKQKIEKLI